MEDIASKLSELLESPDGLDTIKSMASMLLGSAGDEDEAGISGEEFHEDGDHEKPMNSGGLPVSPGEMQTIIKVMGALKSNGDDDRSRLLMALRPHLSEERRPRVDQAVKILKLISVMPLLKETNLLDIF